MSKPTSSQGDVIGLINAVHGVRYQVRMLRAAAFYTLRLMEVGPGGRHIQIEDPDGNPLELFEPASRP